MAKLLTSLPSFLIKNVDTMSKPHYTSVWNLSDIEHLTWPKEVHNEEGYAYIGRGDNGDTYMATNVMPGVLGWLGNPYKTKQAGGQYTREESIEKFKEAFYKRLEEDARFRRHVHALQGNQLVCYCKPKPCHGDVIAEYLNKNLEDLEVSFGETDK